MAEDFKLEQGAPPACLQDVNQRSIDGNHLSDATVVTLLKRSSVASRPFRCHVPGYTSLLVATAAGGALRSALSVAQ